MADMAHMNTDLVCSPGLDLHLNQGSIFEPLSDLVHRDCFAGAMRVHADLFSLFYMSPEACLNGSRAFFNHSRYHSHILFFNDPGLELRGKGAESFLCPG